MSNPKRVASGKWRVRYTDSKGKDRYSTFRKKVDADRFLDDVRGKKATGQHVNPEGERTPLRTVANDWLTARQVGIRPATLDLYRGHLDNHVLTEFGDVPIGRIRRTDIQRWVNTLAGTHAPATVETIFRVLAAVMVHGVEERLIPATEARRIALPKKAAVTHSIVPITAGQVKRLADAAGDMSTLVWFAATTGMRQGECLGLTGDRVDLDARTVRVDRQLVLRSGHAPEFGPPKTDAAVRTIPLADWTCDLIRTHLGDRVGTDRLLFTTSKGEPIRRNRIGEQFRAATGRAELVEVTFHDLRHFYASLLIAGGASVKVVQSRLGHSSAMETLQVYGHLWPDSDDLTRTAVDSLFR